jgi:hypothetical protein
MKVELVHGRARKVELVHELVRGRAMKLVCAPSAKRTVKRLGPFAEAQTTLICLSSCI